MHTHMTFIVFLKVNNIICCVPAIICHNIILLLVKIFPYHKPWLFSGLLLKIRIIESEKQECILPVIFCRVPSVASLIS